MSYYDDLNSVAKRMAELYKPIAESMKYLNTDAITTSSRALSQSMGTIATIQQSILNDSLLESLNSIRSVIASYSLMAEELSENIKKTLEGTRPTIEMINASMSLFKDNYADIMKVYYMLGYNVSSLAETAYEETENDDINDDFSSNEEIIDILQEQVDNPKGFQERFAEWSEKKKKKYYIIIGIIAFIWLHIFAPYFEDNIGKPAAAYVVSKVKELPEATGKVIEEIKKGFQVIITEDVPYYYKVTFLDENGEIREGYVAKKNIKLIEEIVLEEDVDDSQEE